MIRPRDHIFRSLIMSKYTHPASQKWMRSNVKAVAAITPITFFQKKPTISRMEKNTGRNSSICITEKYPYLFAVKKAWNNEAQLVV